MYRVYSGWCVVYSCHLPPSFCQWSSAPSYTVWEPSSRILPFPLPVGLLQFVSCPSEIAVLHCLRASVFKTVVSHILQLLFACVFAQEAGKHLPSLFSSHAKAPFLSQRAFTVHVGSSACSAGGREAERFQAAEPVHPLITMLPPSGRACAFHVFTRENLMASST